MTPSLRTRLEAALLANDQESIQSMLGDVDRLTKALDEAIIFGRIKADRHQWIVAYGSPAQPTNGEFTYLATYLKKRDDKNGN